MLVRIYYLTESGEREKVYRGIDADSFEYYDRGDGTGFIEFAHEGAYQKYRLNFDEFQSYEIEGERKGELQVLHAKPELHRVAREIAKLEHQVDSLNEQIYSLRESLKERFAYSEIYNAIEIARANIN